MYVVGAVDTAPTPFVAGFATVALVDAVCLVFDLPARTSLPARAAVHFYDAFTLVAFGFALEVLAAVVRRVRPGSSRGLGLFAGAAAAGLFASWVLREDLAGAAGKLPQAIPLSVGLVALPVLAAQALPFAALLGTWLARPWLRLVGGAGGATLVVVHNLSYPLTYKGLHLLAALSAGVLCAGSWRGAAVLQRLTPRDARRRRVLTVIAAVAAALSVILPPSNTARQLLAREPSAVLLPYLGRLLPPLRGPRVVPEAQRAWFSDRSSLPSIPPSRPSLIPSNAIVLLISVESLRADILMSARYRQVLPTLFELKDRSTFFSMARAAGSSTAPSLAALFAGVTYSQLSWTRMPSRRRDPLPFPHEDPSPRFPALLSAAGVRTVTADGCGWLLNAPGVLRGFDEELPGRSSGKYEYSERLLARVTSRVLEQGDSPMFLFVHLLDAHFPYVAAGRKATDFEGYLAGLAKVDRQLEKLVKALRAHHLWTRTVLVIMSDHGEAFGEHGLRWHASSLYDELLRVPLLVSLPQRRAQIVEEPVSLLDLGPTILDLMGVATPGRYMGESLVGFLRGERPVLRRPIVAEGRLKRAMVFPDGLKIVHDVRGRYLELFDLRRDPREETNLYVEGSTSSLPRFGALDTFFAEHTLRRPGYEVPYRLW